MEPKQIKMIALESIYPHPDNPRKDLGDLSELTDSIKKNGIMQNLTVMPGHYEGDLWQKSGYTLLIGHRRAAAAREAKMTTVPCTVVQLINRKEQVAIMLEENMQRNDLTIREQAQGFQMMLDLGDTVEDVARKTGFSKQTIKHRIEIAKLDPDAIAAAEEGGYYQISISDYQKLEKLPTVEMRNEVLRDARDGRQLDYKIKMKLDAIKNAAKKETIAKKLEAIGIKKGPANMTRWMSGYEFEFEIQCENAEKNIKAPGKPEECIYGSGWDSVYVLRKEKAKEKGPAQLSEFDLKTNYNRKRTKQMREIQKEMDAKRRSFVLRIANMDVMPAPEDHVRGILEKLFDIMMTVDTWIGEAGLMEYHAQKDRWEMSAEEKDAERQMLRGMSTVGKAVMCVDKSLRVRTGTDVEVLLDYEGRIREDRLEQMKRFYVDILQNEYGYVMDEQEKSILQEGNDVFTPWEAIRDDVMSGKRKI